MPPVADILRSLYGAWRLACGDARGMALFDLSDIGFWRSFFAALIVAPFYAALLGMRIGAGEVASPMWHFLSVEAIAYSISWIAFPVIMEPLSRRLGRGRHYVAFIVPYNWAALLQNALFLPIGMLSVSGALSADAIGFLSLVALAAIALYTWFIAKTALAVSPGIAAAIVGIDFALSLFINAYAESLH